MNRLLEIGFEVCGHWRLTDDRVQLARNSSSVNILYAFVSNGEVLYVGKTKRALSERMANYRTPAKPGNGQSTNIGNHRRIRALLESGQPVDILSLPDSGLMHFGQFHLNLAAGLEDSIIRLMDPPWNGGKVESTADQPADGSKATGASEPTEAAQAAASLPATRALENVAPIAAPVGAAARTAPVAPQVQASYAFKQQPTYRRTGFFNVSVNHEKKFGAGGETIEIFLGDAAQPVLGSINRTANSNETPRIMGGTMVRDWFAATDAAIVRVDVYSPTSIRLRPDLGKGYGR